MIEKESYLFQKVVLRLVALKWCACLVFSFSYCTVSCLIPNWMSLGCWWIKRHFSLDTLKGFVACVWIATFDMPSTFEVISSAVDRSQSTRVTQDTGFHLFPCWAMYRKIAGPCLETFPSCKILEWGVNRDCQLWYNSDGWGSWSHNTGHTWVTASCKVRPVVAR